MPILFKGNGKFDFDIVGEKQYQDCLDLIAGPKEPDGVNHEGVAILSYENDNKFDANAVAVFMLSKNNQPYPVGYLPKAEAAKFRSAFLQTGLGDDIKLCRALVVGGWSNREDKEWLGSDFVLDEGAYGVRLDLVFPLQSQILT